MSLEPGLTAKVKAEVTAGYDGLSQGSGEVEGLATPIMIRSWRPPPSRLWRTLGCPA